MTVDNTTFGMWTGDWQASPQDDLVLMPRIEENVYQRAFAEVEKNFFGKASGVKINNVLLPATATGHGRCCLPPVKSTACQKTWPARHRSISISSQYGADGPAHRVLAVTCRNGLLGGCLAWR